MLAAKLNGKLKLTFVTGHPQDFHSQQKLRTRFSAQGPGGHFEVLLLIDTA